MIDNENMNMRTLLVAVFSAFLALPAAASEETFLKETRRAIGAYFKDRGLMPVVLSAELSPGDVLSWDSWLVDEEAEYCFPNLVPEGPSAVTLPNVSFKGSFEASFLVALGEFFKLSAAGEREFNVFIRYSDVKLTEATRGELRRSLVDECARLGPVLDEEPWSAEDNGIPPLVVGKVVTAKQSVFVVASSKRSAELEAELSKLPIPASRVIQVADPKIAASFGSTSDSGLVIESDLELPVAVAPAFLFGLFPDRRGGDGSDTGEPVFAAREFDPANPEHLKLFELTLEGVLDGPLARPE